MPDEWEDWVIGDSVSGTYVYLDLPDGEISSPYSPKRIAITCWNAHLVRTKLLPVGPWKEVGRCD